MRDDIPRTLVENLPKDLVMGIYDALIAGAERAYTRSKYDNDGHRKTILGNLRNWCMNEEFSKALLAAECTATKLKGNQLVVGKSGIVNVGRINDNNVAWNNLGRSKTRRDLASYNQYFESLIQPGLFDTPDKIPVVTAFFLARFSGSLITQPETPISVEIVIPSADMKHWLFREPVELFLNRYNVVPVQKDDANPTLKRGSIPKDGTEEDDV